MPPVRGKHSLEFFEGGQYVFFTRDDDGAERYKFVSPQAVAAAFRNAPVDSGYLSPGVFRCGAAARGEFATVFLPGQVWPLEFDTEAKTNRYRILSVTLPPLVFFGIGKSYSLWAVKDGAPTPTMKVYAAPLPNVFGHAGICWGVNRPPIATPGTIHQAWDMFIKSPFNGHAATDKSKTYPDDARKLLRKVGTSKFPMGELMPLERTLDEVINQHLGGSD